MTVEMWASVVGFFLPALVSAINHAEWKAWVKAVIALLSSVLVGTVTALLSGDFSGANWIASIGIVFGSSQVAYHTWWKGSQIAQTIENSINLVTRKQQPALGGSPGDSRTTEEEWGPTR